MTALITAIKEQTKIIDSTVSKQIELNQKEIEKYKGQSDD